MPQTTRTTVNQNGQYQTTNSLAVEGIQAASDDAAKRAEIERAKAAVRDQLETGYDQG